MSRPQERLRILISGLTGTFMKETEIFGKQDPYCVFECGGKSLKTAAMRNAGLRADWPGEYSIDDVSMKEARAGVLVCVYNRNHLYPDTNMGCGTVELVEGRNQVSLWKKGEHTGDLTFNVAFSSASIPHPGQQFYRASA